MGDILNAALIIAYGKEVGKRISLSKDVFFLGSGSVCDLVLELPTISEKEIIIERKGRAFVIRSLTNRYIAISGEHVQEKILQEGDVITVGNLELRYTTLMAGAKAGREKELKLKEVMVVILTIAVVIGLIYVIGNIAVDIQRKVVTKKYIKLQQGAGAQQEQKQKIEHLPEGEMTEMVAVARKRIDIANIFYGEKNIYALNIALALFELYDIVGAFFYIAPKPFVYTEACKKIIEIQGHLDERIRYLKNNAFVAIQRGRIEELKYILELIMTLDPLPVDPDHIWAKNKYTEYVLKKK